MGQENVCALNEIYNFLQIPCLGLHSKCLMPQQVFSGLKLTKYLLWAFSQPTPNWAHYQLPSFPARIGLTADLVTNIIVKVSFESSVERLAV